MEVKTVIHATNIGNNIADAKMNFVMINGEDVNVPFNSKKFLSTEDGIVLEGRDAEATIKEHQQKIAQTNNYFMKKVNDEEDKSDEEFPIAQVSSTCTRALQRLEVNMQFIL